MLLLMLSFLAPATDAPPEAQKYLQRCEAAKTVDIAAKEALLKSLAGEKLKLASAEVAKLKAAPARLLHLPLPPRKLLVGGGSMRPTSLLRANGGQADDVGAGLLTSGSFY